MSEDAAEALILAINALGSGILLFISGVLQKMMNDMDEAGFQRFVNALYRNVMKNPFMVTVATLPILVAIPYFWIYGFNHWWFITGFIVWIIGSSITKIINLPIYLWVSDPKNNDSQELRKKRRKLQLGNNLRAWFTFASVVLMAFQFGVSEVVVILAASIIISFPLLWLAGKYTPASGDELAGTSN